MTTVAPGGAGGRRAEVVFERRWVRAAVQSRRVQQHELERPGERGGGDGRRLPPERAEGRVRQQSHKKGPEVAVTLPARQHVGERDRRVAAPDAVAPRPPAGQGFDVGGPHASPPEGQRFCLRNSVVSIPA